MPAYFYSRIGDKEEEEEFFKIVTKTKSVFPVPISDILKKTFFVSKTNFFLSSVFLGE